MYFRQDNPVLPAAGGSVRPPLPAPRLSDARRLRIAGALAIALLVAYGAVLLLLAPLPLQDLPDHVARAVAMNDLLFHGGSRFGSIFHYRFLFVPYLLGDLILTVAVGLWGPVLGGAMWSVLVLLSLPCAVVFYLKVQHTAPDRRVLAVLLSLYLATDWFFLVGFMSFRLAVAMTIATLALAELFRRTRSATRFAAYACALVLGYLMHLSTVVFVGAALGVAALLRLWTRRTEWRTEIALFAPIVAVLMWHFGVANHYRDASDPATSPYQWGTLWGKFVRLDSEFIRFAPHSDELMLLALAACLFALVGVPNSRQLRNPRVLEALATSAVFMALYFVFPMAYSEAGYVDIRPLPLASLYLVFACLSVEPQVPTVRTTHATRTWLAVSAAALLAAVNLAYLTRHWVADGKWLAQYRAIVASIPTQARVLPIYTHGREGHIVPFLHVDSYVAIDRTGVEPYVFAGDNGNPMKYFRYRHRPYDPPETWYGDVPRGEVSWTAVSRDYDFLMLTQPFDPKLLRIPTRTVAANSSAALLAVVK